MHTRQARFNLAVVSFSLIFMLAGIVTQVACR